MRMTMVSTNLTIRLTLLLTVGCCAFMRPAFAQKVGSTSMQFLKVLPCARATALGEAYSVWASGAEAVFWNPSGLALIDGQEISTTYIDWLDRKSTRLNSRHGHLSYA